MSIATLIERHQPTLDAAIEANRTRTFHAHWPEPPSGKIYGETANDDGLSAFKSQIGKPFPGLLQTGGQGAVGEEQSPYGFPLEITYPLTSVTTLVSNASSAQLKWQTLSALERSAILVEALERASKRFFEIGYATMHTTGQGFVMAFQSSGPHGFDRALESTALGLAAQLGFASGVQWTKPMGKISVTIDKTYRVVPKGINLVIGCSTFPVWNSVPGMFAGLVTGNSVVVKPHPGAIYPIAIIVAELQKVLDENGLDPHVCQLAADTISKPLTMDLLRHPAIRVVDYTGGPTFGRVVQEEALKAGKTVFTELAGVNSVIIDSAVNIDKAIGNIAFSISLYAGQMCTAPQNIYVPATGVTSGDTTLSVDDIAAKLKEHVDGLVGNPKMGPGTLGTIQNKVTLDRIKEAEGLSMDVIRGSESVEQHGFADARTASPLILKADPSQEKIYTREWFGPITFVIPTASYDEAVTLVAKSVREHGALTTSVYTTDEGKMQRAEDAIVNAGAPVAFNLDSFVWVNQSAAFSDFHGSGANPAGNASFADWSFVTNRYNVIGVRKQG